MITTEGISARDALAAAMSEDVLLESVIALARALGWKVHHCRPARKLDGSWSTPVQGDPGYPDLTLAKVGRLMFVELKSERGSLSAQQRAWLNILEREAEVWVWKPHDWLSGEVESQLRGLVPRDE